MLRPSIFACIFDAANFVTLVGLGCSGIAISAAGYGAYHLAGLAMVGAYLADLFDGVIARSSSARDPRMSLVGARLDSLADQVGGGVTPGVILLAYGGWNPWLVGPAVVMLAATAMRLAYFDVHGLDENGAHTGLPTDLVVLLFALLLLAEGSLSERTFVGTLLLGGLLAAGLMVSRIRIPKVSGRSLLSFATIAGVVGTVHLWMLI